MTESIPDWAWERAYDLSYEGAPRFDSPHTGFRISRTAHAFARYIAEHEEPPVDPLLIEARTLASAHWAKDQSPGEFRDKYIASVMAGEVDANPSAAVSLALTALRRGIELTKASA